MIHYPPATFKCAQDLLWCSYQTHLFVENEHLQKETTVVLSLQNIALYILAHHFPLLVLCLSGCFN